MKLTSLAGHVGLTGIAVLCLVSSAGSFAQSAAQAVQDKALFDWAEIAFPRFFLPAGPPTVELQGYLTRY